MNSQNSTKTIYLVRHGESQANLDGVMAGSRNDSPLTEKGKQQAREAAELIRMLPVDMMIVSPMERTKQTADIIIDAIGYKGDTVIEPLFIERDFGDATNLSREQALRMVDEGSAKGAESVDDLYIRAKKALDYLRSLPEEHILIVGHAGFGRMMGAIANGLAAEDFLKQPRLGNAEIYQFLLDK